MAKVQLKNAGTAVLGCGKVPQYDVYVDGVKIVTVFKHNGLYHADKFSGSRQRLISYFEQEGI